MARRKLSAVQRGERFLRDYTEISGREFREKHGEPSMTLRKIVADLLDEIARRDEANPSQRGASWHCSLCGASKSQPGRVSTTKANEK